MIRYLNGQTYALYMEINYTKYLQYLQYIIFYILNNIGNIIRYYL